MSHHNNAVDLYGRTWIAPNYQIAEGWRVFVANRGFSGETEASSRANNKYVDVVFRLNLRGNNNTGWIRSGSPLVDTGEIIDGKMVVTHFDEEEYSGWTEHPDGADIVGVFDSYGFFGEGGDLGSVGYGNSGTVPSVNGPEIDPDDNTKAYFPCRMMVEGYTSMRNTQWNYNEHYPQSGVPIFPGYYGVMSTTVDDDSWYPVSATAESLMTYVGPPPSRPTQFSYAQVYFAGTYTV